MVDEVNDGQDDPGYGDDDCDHNAMDDTWDGWDVDRDAHRDNHQHNEPSPVHPSVRSPNITLTNTITLYSTQDWLSQWYLVLC